MLRFLNLLTSFFVVETALGKTLPILLWHSLGASFESPETSAYKNFLRSQLGDEVYIKSASIDRNEIADIVESLIVHPFEQIDWVCKSISNDPAFVNGYNAVGLSQGGLLVRGLAQTCPVRMHNLVSLGGPQQGVFRIPHCEDFFSMLCSAFQWIVEAAAYWTLSQKFFAPLTYWHDPDESKYRESSTFLAIINNEKEFNQDYARNLSKLQHLVLVKYEADKIIVPKMSSWFGFFDSAGNEFSMEETEIYKNDRLGLESMQQNGQLVLLEAPRDHLELDEDWFIENILPYLRND